MTDDTSPDRAELEQLRRTVAHYQATEAARYASTRCRNVDTMLTYIELNDGGLPLDQFGRLDVHALDQRITEVVAEMPATFRA